MRPRDCRGTGLSSSTELRVIHDTLHQGNTPDICHCSVSQGGKALGSSGLDKSKASAADGQPPSLPRSPPQSRQALRPNRQLRREARTMKSNPMITCAVCHWLCGEIWESLCWWSQLHCWQARPPRPSDKAAQLHKTSASPSSHDSGLPSSRKVKLINVVHCAGIK